MSHPADRGTVVTLSEGAFRIAVARGMEFACWPAPIEGEGAGALVLGFAHPVYGWMYFAIDAASSAKLAADLAAFAQEPAPLFEPGAGSGPNGGLALGPPTPAPG